ncbi:transporter [Streptomyces sp. NPDC058171]
MGDLKAFRVDGGRAVEMAGSSVALERELQSLIEGNMEAMLGIRFLTSEYETGRHRGRIDSLGLDETGAPVIVEYKRTRDKEVVTQALSYLAWLNDSHAEFEGLVRDRLGAEAAGSVDWSRPRIVCVAGDFTPHTVVALEMIRHRIDLVAYRVFENVVALRLVASFTGPSSAPVVPRSRAVPGVALPVEEVPASGGGKTVQQYLDASPQGLKDLFADLDEVLMESGSVQREVLQHYIAYRRLKNVASVKVQPRKRALVMVLKVDPDSVELVEGFTRDVRGIGFHGTGALEVRIRSHANLERAGDLIRRSVESG